VNDVFLACVIGLFLDPVRRGDKFVYGSVVAAWCCLMWGVKVVVHAGGKLRVEAMYI
jgi:hypothetical protein